MSKAAERLPLSVETKQGQAARLRAAISAPTDGLVEFLEALRRPPKFV
jgi:hypothetical protein